MRRKVGTKIFDPKSGAQKAAHKKRRTKSGARKAARKKRRGT